MTTNNTETTTNTTKQRIFIQGVEHRFRVGEKVRIKDTAIVNKFDEERGNTVTIRAYDPVGRSAGYYVDPHGGWYEEQELEALPEAAAPAHGLKVGDIVRFINQVEYEGWNGWRIAKDWGLGSRIGVRFRVKAVPAHGKSVVLDTPFSGGKGTGCKVKRIVKSMFADETATQKTKPPVYAAPEVPTAPKLNSKFFLVLSEENEPGGTFDNCVLAWQKATELAKEPGAVPYYVFEVKAKVTPKVTRTVATETTTY